MTELEQYLMWFGAISTLLLLTISYSQREMKLSASLAVLMSSLISLSTLSVMSFFLIGHYFFSSIDVGKSINGIVPLFAVCHLLIHNLKN